MTNDQIERLQRFIEYGQKLKGDEKGEAQVFCDRLFQAFGHAGYKEAGATLEDRQQRKGKNVKFIDLLAPEEVRTAHTVTRPTLSTVRQQAARAAMIPPSY